MANNSSNIKQVIVVRKDLNMRKGKIAAQVAHAAMKVFFDRMDKIEREAVEYDFTTEYINKCQVHFTKEMQEWMQGAFTKVVVGVDSEDEIYQLAEKAKQANIPYAIIIDNGFTEFHGNKTTTCIAIGPAESEKLAPITGDLSLI